MATGGIPPVEEDGNEILWPAQDLTTEVMFSLFPAEASLIWNTARIATNPEVSTRTYLEAV